MRRSFWIAATMGVALALSSCSSPEVGSPTTVERDPGSTSTQSSDPSPTTSPTSVKPCELLTDSEASSIGADGAGQPKKTKGSTGCRWRVEKALAADSYNVDVTYYEARSLDDVVSSQTKKPMKLGSHDAIEVLGDNKSGCIVAIAVSDTTRVDVVVAGGEQTRLCAPAVDVAKLIEPRLP
ncbi:DUF3558 domain-containing protein [Actinokineospora globicatena]|uniref:DUF3558 domain-containing protein n=1 Tax=Actinokineospora globicatena TaxID=103729 RepID=A0A9W6VCM6_9PSEU|nr:DUF3558 domain-containing protein [Actinokineospora globicatena]GLW95119.1 hypothetical protein Aglo03_59350 [Actinokineospora globicatena]